MKKLRNLLRFVKMAKRLWRTYRRIEEMPKSGFGGVHLTYDDIPKLIDLAPDAAAVFIEMVEVLKTGKPVPAHERTPITAKMWKVAERAVVILKD